MQKIFRLPAAIEFSGLSRSSIYRLIKLGKFPAPVRIGEAATAWLEDDLKAWLESRPKLDRRGLDGEAMRNAPQGKAGSTASIAGVQ